MAPKESRRRIRARSIGRLCWLGAAIFASAACGDVAQPALKPQPTNAIHNREQHVAESQANMATNTKLVSLAAKLTKTDGRLDVQYTVQNGSESPILVFNRLHSGGHPREVDNELAYRFVSGDVLNLLLGPAPLPSVPVTFKNMPEVTRIEPYASFRAQLSAPIPVIEYSVYFEPGGPDKHVAGTIHKVELFANYVDATGIETIESKTFPGAFTAMSPGKLQTVRSGPIALTLDVVREAGDFSRLESR